MAKKNQSKNTAKSIMKMISDKDIAFVASEIGSLSVINVTSKTRPSMIGYLEEFWTGYLDAPVRLYLYL